MSQTPDHSTSPKLFTFSISSMFFFCISRMSRLVSSLSAVPSFSFFLPQTNCSVRLESPNGLISFVYLARMKTERPNQQNPRNR